MNPILATLLLIPAFMLGSILVILANFKGEWSAALSILIFALPFFLVMFLEFFDDWLDKNMGD